MEYNFKTIEKKWQAQWEKEKIFEVTEDKKKKKFYVLEMYPYPSASFLHMGHVRNYTIGDVFARFKRMNGFNVLYPMGYDSFGLPAETAAKKEGIHPKKYSEESMKKIMQYQKALGNSYAWNRILYSHDANYYLWNQYFFLKMYEKGLAYRKEAPVNWCGECESVLANEEAEGGKCWRCGKEVVVKNLAQWFYKITDYADRLLEDLDKIDWPEKIKTMQRNWIGKSEGTEINFNIEGEKISVFTTRPDTIYGVTFLVISAQHPKLMQFVKSSEKEKVKDFLKKIKSIKQENADKLEKDGVFTGSYAEHPTTKEKIPIYVGNFVVADYGSGIVMAVPAHDQRDFEFAKKYNLLIKKVIESLESKVITIKKSLKDEFYKEVGKFAKIISNNGLVNIYTDKIDEVFSLAKGKFIGSPWYIHSEGKIKKILFHSQKEDKIFDWSNEKGNNEAKKFGARIKIKKEQLDFDEIREAYVSDGVLINSGGFNGVDNREAKSHITQFLEDNGEGRGEVVQFRIKDWMISRQRYWGTPIPIIYCGECGIVPVPEKELPILLPEKVDFQVKTNPLLTAEKFINTKCPKCNSKARRETDTMGGFVDSSWYFLRFCDSKNKKNAFDKNKSEYWMPVDQYIGGAEHAVMHLIYARFFTKVLKDLEIVNIDEPFSKLFNQGIVYKDGAKMSKSKGNIVFQTEISDKYGIDTARLFLMSVASPDKQMEWSDEGVEGSFRAINKLIKMKEKISDNLDARQDSKVHSRIKSVTNYIDSFEYPKAIISIFEIVEYCAEKISKKNYEIILKLLHPFCPHITEELWHKIGNKNFISLEKWPVADERKINEDFEKQEQIVEKLIEDINQITRIVKEKGDRVSKAYIYIIPNEKEVYNYSAELIKKKTNIEIQIFSVNDKKKYDPEGKSKKAKQGKPGIYLE